LRLRKLALTSTAEIAQSMLKQRKNQAIRLYLFLASAKIPQHFSSRRRLLLHHTRNKKDTASILCRVQRMPSMASAEHGDVSKVLFYYGLYSPYFPRSCSIFSFFDYFDE